MVERPVLRYFGGKWVLAPWIIQNLPQHDIYIEPFGGAASVLMRKPRTYHEVYNDLNDEIVNVFQILRDPQLWKELENNLRKTPFARAEYDIAFQPSENSLEQARRTIMKSFMGFGGDSSHTGKQTGFRSISGTTKRGTTPPAEWVSLADCVESWHERLAGVAIEKRDAFELIPLHDSPEALFFVDPPYVHDTRCHLHGYKYEMTDIEHEKLLVLLAGLKGMVVLCGYESPIYKKLGWHVVNKNTFADGARERTECLWLNGAAVDKRSQIEMAL
jgi:DNA adenine methylase